MKKFLNKTTSLAVIFAMLFSLFVPILVSASNYRLGEGIANSNASKNELYQYNVNPNEVTLYIGNISINHGCRHERYLYTDKEVNEQTLNKIRDILTIDYKNMLPNQPGQILVNNFGADMTIGNWKNAYDIAVQRYGVAKVEKTEYGDKSLYYKATLNKLRRENRQECEQEKQNKLEILGDKKEKNAVFKHFIFNGNVDLNDSDSFMVDTLTESKSKNWILDNSKKTLNGKLNYKNVNHDVKVFDIDRTIVRVVSTSATVKLPNKMPDINISIARPVVGTEINLNIYDDDSDNENPDGRPIVKINTKGISGNYDSMWLKKEHFGNLWDIDNNSAFIGKFEENKEYEALVCINIDTPYDLADRINILINGKPPTAYTVCDNGILLAVAKTESQK